MLVEKEARANSNKKRPLGGCHAGTETEHFGVTLDEGETVWRAEDAQDLK